MYPDYYPSNCPLEGHQPIENDSIYYRFVQEISDEYLQTPYELAGKKFPKGATNKKKCEKCALSIFKNIQDMRDLNQKGELFSHTKGWKISEVVLKSTWGRIKPDDNLISSHCNWWLPDGINKNEILNNMELT